MVDDKRESERKIDWEGRKIAKGKVKNALRKIEVRLYKNEDCATLKSND